MATLNCHGPVDLFSFLTHILEIRSMILKFIYLSYGATIGNLGRGWEDAVTKKYLFQV